MPTEIFGKTRPPEPLVTARQALLWLLFVGLLLSVGFALRDARTNQTTALPKGQIETIVKDFLLAHPEVIQQALTAHAQREDEAQQARVQDAIDQHHALLTADPASPVAGNPQGDATIVEFFDYLCAHCRRVEPAIADMVKSDPNLRVVYKQFPIMGHESTMAARAALAAARQGKYTQMHAALMHAKPLDAAAIEASAKSLGLDMTRFHSDRDSEAVTAQLLQDYALAQNLGLQGTPAFVVGRQLLAGGGNMDSIKALVALERELAKTDGSGAAPTRAASKP